MKMAQKVFRPYQFKKIQPGETVAFVGQKWFRKKTTLCNLLPRFFMKSVVVKLRLTIEISSK